MWAMGADVVGANCGRGFDEMESIARKMVEARPEGSLLLMQSNAGLPELVGADFVYNGTPDGMGDLARLLKDLGVDVVGSCCGATPEHGGDSQRDGAVVARLPRWVGVANDQD